MKGLNAFVKKAPSGEAESSKTTFHKWRAKPSGWREGRNIWGYVNADKFTVCFNTTFLLFRKTLHSLFRSLTQQLLHSSSSDSTHEELSEIAKPSSKAEITGREQLSVFCVNKGQPPLTRTSCCPRNSHPWDHPCLWDLPIGVGVGVWY